MKFETGATYKTRSICQSDTAFTYTIERRTAKSVWIDGKRFGIKNHNDTEIIYPEGKYSKCPVLKATKKVA